MTMNITRRPVLSLIAAALAAPAWAEVTYPTKPVRLVVPMAAGGNGDIIARLIGQELQAALGQPVVVENKAGAGGNIGADYVAKSAPDGYALVLGAVGTHAINASLYKNMPYDVRRDFAPVTMMASVPNVLVVHPRVPAENVQELVAYIRQNPGKVNFASSGAGSSIHLSGEMFRSMEHLEMTHVPYKGSAPALADLLGGQVQLMFDNLPTSLPHIKAGKLRALAVTSLKRSPSLPNVPTMTEAGVPNFEAGSWFGILAPANTPKAVVAKLDQDIRKALERQDVQRKLVDLGFQPNVKGPEAFAAYMDQEITKWGKVVRESGASAE